jgi:hypothetical protein
MPSAVATSGSASERVPAVAAGEAAEPGHIQPVSKGDAHRAEPRDQVKRARCGQLRQLRHAEADAINHADNSDIPVLAGGKRCRRKNASKALTIIN